MKDYLSKSPEFSVVDVDMAGSPVMCVSRSRSLEIIAACSSFAIVLLYVLPPSSFIQHTINYVCDGIQEASQFFSVHVVGE